MDTYEIVGFSSFTSKKGNPCYVLYVKYDGGSHVTGEAVDKFFCAQDSVSDKPYVGAMVNIYFGRTGYVQRVEII